jgi:transcriptional regulator with XRE-family HTH domain
VRRERSSRRLTQERFAELVDLNIRTVQKIEAGEINILVTTLLRIQRALNCSWDDLLK